LIRQLLESEKQLLKDDPVRPHIPYVDRTRTGCVVNVLEEENQVKAIICTALCTEVPTNEQQLKEFTSPTGDILVAYTVWSYSKGAGRIIINELRFAADVENISRIVTLSPLTEMAERFHLRNGAKLIGKYKDCQNFEYTL
jgi:hypothetical protein